MLPTLLSYSFNFHKNRTATRTAAAYFLEITCSVRYLCLGVNIHATKWFFVAGAPLHPPTHTHAPTHSLFPLPISNHFKTRKLQNADRGYAIILEFYHSKMIGFGQSSHSEISRDAVLLTWSLCAAMPVKTNPKPTRVRGQNFQTHFRYSHAHISSLISFNVHVAVVADTVACEKCSHLTLGRFRPPERPNESVRCEAAVFAGYRQPSVKLNEVSNNNDSHNSPIHLDSQSILLLTLEWTSNYNQPVDPTAYHSVHHQSQLPEQNNTAGRPLTSQHPHAAQMSPSLLLERIVHN